MDKHEHHHDGKRVEDFRLITGTGKYAADWKTPGQLYGHFVRSDHAHAEILSVNATRALAHPGVKGVYTGADAVAAGYVRAAHVFTAPGKDGMKAIAIDRPVLAHGKTRFAGEAVALVVAESAGAAADAAELVEVEYKPLTPIVNPKAALAPDAPQIEASIPGNLVYEVEAGNLAAVEEAFKKAAHITRLTVESTRVTPSPMEPRACMVTYDAANESYHFNVVMQGVTTLRKMMHSWTHVPEEKLVFEAHDVGGGFGQRTPAYPEYIALMIAAKALGRPVQWVSSRVESFLTDNHGRGNIVDGQLAMDKDGRFLAMRMDFVSDMGAYLSPGAMGHIRNSITCLTGVYHIPVLYGLFKVPITNTTPMGSYRGAGRPDVAYAVERIVDQAAIDMGLDRADIRRRNFIPANAFPYKTATGSSYENADFAGLMSHALALADWSGFDARRAQSAKAGKLRGIGISTVIEGSGAGNAPRDEVELTLDANGTVTLHTVAKTQGHGHETTFGTIVANALGIPLSQVKVVQCLPGTMLEGNHTGGSRSTVGAGSVSHLAALKLIEEGKALAALELNLEPSQVQYSKGEFKSKDSKRVIKLAGVAKAKTISVTAEGKFGSTFPNGCHITEVEIDPQTGAPQIVAYNAVDDCGVVINHAIVEGQVHGGVVQGAGQVFGEQIVYDQVSGQPLTASFMDYTMPRAGLVPAFNGEEHATTSKVSPLGVKGVGESGCTASIPSLVSAVLDAVRPVGVKHLDMPMTPSRLWTAVNGSQAR